MVIEVINIKCYLLFYALQNNTQLNNGLTIKIFSMIFNNLCIF